MLREQRTHSGRRGWVRAVCGTACWPRYGSLCAFMGLRARLASGTEPSAGGQCESRRSRYTDERRLRPLLRGPEFTGDARRLCRGNHVHQRSARRGVDPGYEHYSARPPARSAGGCCRSSWGQVLPVLASSSATWLSAVICPRRSADRAIASACLCCPAWASVIAIWVRICVHSSGSFRNLVAASARWAISMACLCWPWLPSSEPCTLMTLRPAPCMTSGRPCRLPCLDW